MFISNSADETAAVGRQYANTAQAGDVFALSGELGAGKNPIRQRAGRRPG